MIVNTIPQEQPEYPRALVQWLGNNTPTHLSYIGNIEILKQPLLGLFSSVKCPANLIIKAHDLAHKLGEAGTPVISGFHSPVEKEMLSVLLRGQGPVVLCPARGLGKIRLSKIQQQALEENRLLLISLFTDGVMRSREEYALQRNLFVAALAKEVVVVYSAPSGNVEKLCIQLNTWKKKVTYI